jgi:hypothetical protein
MGLGMVVAVLKNGPVRDLVIVLSFLGIGLFIVAMFVLSKKYPQFGKRSPKQEFDLKVRKGMATCYYCRANMLSFFGDRHDYTIPTVCRHCGQIQPLRTLTLRNGTVLTNQPDNAQNVN